MPSPIGHFIAGVAAGWLVSGAPRRAERQRAWLEAGLFGALGALPDVDLLVGAHSGPTHGIGAAALVGLAALALQIARAPDSRGKPVLAPGLLALACFAAYGSHVLLDWLARDTTPPIGIMALWPFSREHYQSELHLFMAISRRYHQGWSFVRQNTLALTRELAILLPVLIAVLVLRRRIPAAEKRAA
jgi:membrane-bound metal-dependent hydrolase YbcI (DUF457 family)